MKMKRTLVMVGFVLVAGAAGLLSAHTDARAKGLIGEATPSFQEVPATQGALGYVPAIEGLNPNRPSPIPGGGRAIRPTVFERWTAQIEQHLADGRWLAGADMIARVPTSWIQSYIPWFEARAHLYPPLWLYQFARRMEQVERYVKAVRWYISARERHLYHVRRCLDQTTLELINLADAQFRDLRNIMQARPEITAYALRQAFAWHDKSADTDEMLIHTCTQGEDGLKLLEKSYLLPVGRERPNGVEKHFVLAAPGVVDPRPWIVPENENLLVRTWVRQLMTRDLQRLIGQAGAAGDVDPGTGTTPLR